MRVFVCGVEAFGEDFVFFRWVGRYQACVDGALFVHFDVVFVAEWVGPDGASLKSSDTCRGSSTTISHSLVLFTTNICTGIVDKCALLRTLILLQEIVKAGAPASILLRLLLFPGEFLEMERIPIHKLFSLATRRRIICFYAWRAPGDSTLGLEKAFCVFRTVEAGFAILVGGVDFIAESVKSECDATADIFGELAGLRGFVDCDSSLGVYMLTLEVLGGDGGREPYRHGYRDYNDCSCERVVRHFDRKLKEDKDVKCRTELVIQERKKKEEKEVEAWRK